MGKSADLHAKGFPAFLAGDFTPFTGFDQAVVGNQLLIAARFKAHTEHEIRVRVLNPIEDIEGITGCKFLLAGRDYPLHCTMKVGTYSGDENNKVLRFMSIALHPELYMLRQSMCGKLITFENLVIDAGGNGLLTNDFVNEDVFRFRNRAHNFLLTDTDCFAPLPIDWVHCSLFRTFKGANPNTNEFFSDLFEDLLANFKTQTFDHPLETEIAEVVVVNCYDFLT